MAALFVMIPLLFTSQGLLAANDRQHTAQQTVVDWLPEDGDLLLQDVSVSRAPDTSATVVDVAVTGPGRCPAPRRCATS